jgi:hypothetical protein
MQLIDKEHGDHLARKARLQTVSLSACVLTYYFHVPGSRGDVLAIA